jgi:hypothetical protein
MISQNCKTANLYISLTGANFKPARVCLKDKHSEILQQSQVNFDQIEYFFYTEMPHQSSIAHNQKLTFY